MLVLSTITIIFDIADSISNEVFVSKFDQTIRTGPSDVRPEPENPEEPAPSDESEAIEDRNEFDIVDEYDDGDL